MRFMLIRYNICWRCGWYEQDGAGRMPERVICLICPAQGTLHSPMHMVYCTDTK